eukprot:s478_g12.t1
MSVSTVSSVKDGSQEGYATLRGCKEDNTDLLEPQGIWNVSDQRPVLRRGGEGNSDLINLQADQQSMSQKIQNSKQKICGYDESQDETIESTVPVWKRKPILRRSDEDNTDLINLQGFLQQSSPDQLQDSEESNPLESMCNGEHSWEAHLDTKTRKVLSQLSHDQWTWTCRSPNETERGIRYGDTFKGQCQDVRMWDDSNVRAASAKTAKGQSVRFNTQVQIFCFEGHESLSATIDADQVEVCVRSMWHLHGQVTEFQQWNKIFHYYTKDGVKYSGQQQCQQTDGSLMQPSEAASLHDGDQYGMTGKDDTNVLLFQQILDEQANYPIFADTWFLQPVQTPLCVRPRKLKLMPQMKDQSVLHHHCKMLWQDLADHRPISIQFIFGHTRLASVRLHIIILQGDMSNFHQTLVWSDMLPPLFKYRAVLFPQETLVRDFFNYAQFGIECQHPRRTCFLKFAVDDGERFLTNYQVFHPPQNALVEGCLRIVAESDETDDENDDNDDVSETGSFASQVTTAGEGVESEDDDTSFMSGRPVVAQFDDDAAYPWIQHQWDQEQPPEEEIDIDFAEHHETHVEEYINAVLHEAPDQEQMWRAITFGVEVADLGRREFDFPPRDLNMLLGRVHEAWAEYAERARLTVYYVYPQPSDIGGERSIVLIVNVETPETLEEDTRYILVTERGVPGTQFRAHPYAARVTTAVNARAVLAQLNLHRQCYPFTMRPCEVRMAFTMMNEDRPYDVEHGANCNVWFSDLPTEVQFAENWVGEADAFLLQLRDNAWISQMRQLWPFEPSGARIVFVAAATDDYNDQQPAVYHFIVGYGESEGALILVSQQLVAVDAPNSLHNDVQERWAVLVDEILVDPAILSTLTQRPFWFARAQALQVQPHCRVNGVRIGDFGRMWTNGDLLQVRLLVWQTQHILHIMTGRNEQEANMQLEYSSFLQTQVISLHEALHFEDDNHDQSAQLHSISGPKMQLQRHRNDDNGGDAKLTKTKSGLADESLGQLNELKHLIDCLCGVPWIGFNNDFESIPQMHPYARAAIDLTGTQCNGRRLHIFTDGSSSKRKAAWAFVILNETRVNGNSVFHKLGFAGGRLKEDIVPCIINALDAEATAIIAATEYLLSVSWIQTASMVFHYDALAAGHGAMGMQNVPQNDHGPSFRQHAARLMIAILQQRAEACCGFHVKAHQGQPWNEAADSLANAIRKGWTPDNEAVLRSKDLLQHPLANFAWIEIAPNEEIPSLEEMLCNDSPDRDKDVLGIDATLAIPSKPEEGLKRVDTLCLATANVHTLDYQGTELEFAASTKIDSIMQQMLTNGIHIVALQETRARQTRTATIGPYTRFISAGERGQAGVELWLHGAGLSSLFGFGFDPTKDVCIWCHTHRILTATCTFGALKVELLVIYAPQQGRPHAEIQQWWEELDGVLQKIRPQTPIFLLGDCNAHVGSVECTAIGSCHADIEDRAGTLLRQLCEKHGLVIPSTHEHYHEGCGHTYQGPKGHRSRIDFIAISDMCAPGIQQSFVDYDIDLMNGDKDHYAVRLNVQLVFTSGKADQVFRRHKKEAWKKWIRDQLQQKVDTLNKSKAENLYQVLQPKKAIEKAHGKLLRPLPGLKDGEGNWKTTREEVAFAWQKQFSQIENAAPISFESLLERSVPNAQVRTVQDLYDIPTVFELERALRNMQDAKSPGVDSLGAEVFQSNPATMAKRLYSLFIKSALRGQGITEMAGGWLLALYKGRGNPKDMTTHRAIMLEAVVARIFSRAWRLKIVRGLETIACPMQFGGRSGLSIEALHLHVKMAMQNALHQKQSHAAVFIDIRSAFYSIAKPLLTGCSRDVSHVRHIFEVMHLPEEVWCHFLQNIQDANLVRKATQSQLVTENITSNLDQTWFVVPDAQGPCAPLTGSRPGDPMADVLFAMVMARIIAQINRKADMAGIPLLQPVPGGQVSNTVTWVDDLAISLQESAEHIVSKTIHIIAIIQETMLEHGLSLSYGAGKSAVMFTFHGPQATKARQDCEAEHKQGIVVLTEYEGAVTIPVVTHYKHLGGHLTRNGAILPEIQVRIASTMSKLKPLRRILTCKDLQLECRRQLVRTMGMTVLTLHTGSWWRLTQAELSAWHSAVFRVYHSIHGRDEQGQVVHKDYFQLADDVQLPMPMELLYLQRLKLLFHLIKVGDPHMISAVLHNDEQTADASWLQGTLQSLKWMQQQLGDEDVPSELFQLRERETWSAFQDASTDLHKLLKKAEKAHLLRVKSFLALRTFAVDQSTIFQQMGHKIHEESLSSQTDEKSFQCDECEQSFATSASLAVHQQRKHGQRAAVRRFVTDGVCRACGKTFHTRPRLIHHLQHGQTQCWVFHLRQFAPMSEEMMNELDAADRTAGTVLHRQGFQDPVHNQLWRWATEDEMKAHLPCIAPFPVSNEDPDMDELAAWKQLGLLPAGRGGREKTIRSPGDIHVYNVAHETALLEVKLQQQVSKWEHDSMWVPKPLSDGRKFMLILFSGHRRECDVAQYLSWTSDLIPLSVDLIDRECGNIMDTTIWFDLIRSRRVSGAHAAPPCETFSLARWIDLEQEAAPRPLRDVDNPWGVLHRTLREVAQLTIGNLLMVRALYLLLLVYFHGGSVTLEHPAEITNKSQKWTIWDSAFLHLFLTLKDVYKMRFLQGPLGRPFCKPTNLLVGRINNMQQMIFSKYDRKWKQSETLGGKSNGAWRTSWAKEYPPRLCQAIAEGHASHYNEVRVQGADPEPPSLQKFLDALAKPFDPYLGMTTGTIMKSDYDRSAYFRN